MGRLITDTTPNNTTTIDMTDAELLKFIGILTDRLRVHQEAVATILAARNRAFRDGCARDGVKQGRMAEVAGVSSAAITAALKKEDERAGAG